MIYLDTSVGLAHILAETHAPPARLWDGSLVSSRVLQYEAWTRLHARNLTTTHGDHLDALLERVDLLDLAEPVLKRALSPFPMPVRTLDAIHLATMEFLRTQGQSVSLASYDKRLIAAARELGITLFDLTS